MTSPTPNFFIVGAPKCGTTTLYRYLSKHPLVFMPAQKEPCFFNSDMVFRRHMDASSYRRNFADARPEHLRIGEACVFYLYSKVAIAEIERCYEEPLYIACLRSPYELVESWFAQLRYDGFEDAPTLEIAWELQTDRAQGRKVPRLCPDPQLLQYRNIASIGSQVTRLLQQVDRSRVKFVLTDDLRTNAEAYYDIVDFLGLPLTEAVQPDFSVHNPRKASRYYSVTWLLYQLGRISKIVGLQGTGLLAPIYRLNQSRSPDVVYSANFSRTLKRVFEPEIQLLRDALGWELGWEPP